MVPTQANEVRDSIIDRASEGEPLESIEHELIDPSPLSEDEKSSLWLYAWSMRDLCAGRRARGERQQVPLGV